MGLTIDDITFRHVLQESDYSSVFQVTLQEKPYVLKVYHILVRSHADSKNREIDPFTCESTAYCRLKDHGLCQQGIVPDFHGVIKQIDPTSCEPFLDGFLNDKILPSAILLEYIPDMHKIDLSNFSVSRVTKLRTILERIHNAGILHDDPYPRNMMIQSHTDRVLWIDFDRAQTFSEDQTVPDPRFQLEWIREEKELVDEFFNDLAQDHKDGKLSRAWSWYYS